MVRSHRWRICAAKLLNFIAYFNHVFAKPFQLDVHGSPAEGEGSGVKLGKRANQGMSFASLVFNYEKPV